MEIKKFGEMVGRLVYAEEKVKEAVKLSEKSWETPKSL